MNIVDRIDHLVLTVEDIPKTMSFYTDILGMEPVFFGNERIALKFGKQKMNLHDINDEATPKAAKPQPGSADLCLILDPECHLNEMIGWLRHKNVPILAGPAPRMGTLGEIKSIYIRDPDGNLVELSCY